MNAGLTVPAQPADHLIVDIDRVDSMETDCRLETVADLQRALAMANQFTDAELAINREGRIAKAQVYCSLRRALGPLVTASGVLLGSVLFLSASYEFLLLSHALVPRTLLASVPRTISALVAIRVSGFAVFGAVLITFSAVVATLSGFFESAGALFNLALDLVDGRAYCIEGRTCTSCASEGGQSLKALIRVERYWYVVRNEYLRVTRDAYDVLRPYSDSTCKVYMTPRSKLLLSLEPVKIRRA